LVAVEAVRKFGAKNVILVNHDISSEVEHEDIKRFKVEVAEYLKIPITYVNMDGWETMTPLDVSVQSKGFQFRVGQAICTNKLKTAPFDKWLAVNYPASSDEPNRDITILYGFDKDEPHRIQRRTSILKAKGYMSDYPLANWNRTIFDIEEIEIKRPCTYATFKHANCVGCLKAGRQHWYVVYCLYPHIFRKAVEAENVIGHSIIKGVYLNELIPKFKAMQKCGIIPSEKEQPQTFWARVKKELKI
jgi:hypothetical protein